MAQLAPSCVEAYERDLGDEYQLLVRDRCDKGYRIKVVPAFSTDFRCTFIRAGDEYFCWDWGRFDRLELC